MNLPLTFWCNRFALQAAVWTLAILAIIDIGVGLIYPASRWLFADGWQWMPLQKWVGWLLMAAVTGPLPGGFFTLGEWLQHAQSSRVQKLVISFVVISTLVYLCVVLCRPSG